ncbi:C1p1p GTPase and Pre-mRNA cleavage complex protein [Cryptosporidium canis]|uniref:C1p1p GTPase and Pre-mRNA cleavage complex protein n=1 Tax=Cryptosporidium canis TaxID=195482 RepID=A0ABQ8P5R4_9CRYT|nr:C1p1p GTPase and Pre-mRNA cleavage complex protein [Cryptosporidium canis]
MEIPVGVGSGFGAGYGGDFGAGAGSGMAKSQVRAYKIEAGSELRIIAHPSQPCTIRLYSSGVMGAGSQTNVTTSAEIFGAEIPPDIDVKIAPLSRIAIYTWHGCILQIRGPVQQEYESVNKSMKEYMEVIQVLDNRRNFSKLHGTSGPRVLVTGSSNSGKSTLCQILCNYAARRGYTPLFIDLDPRGSTDKANMQFPAGIIGATKVDEFFLHGKELKSPLSFFFGHLNVTDDIQLYLYLCRLLSGAIRLRSENNQDTNSQASGFIINAPFQPSNELLKDLISIFEIDVIVVMDDPSTQHYLADQYGYKEPQNYEVLEKLYIEESGGTNSSGQEQEGAPSKPRDEKYLERLPKISVVGVSKSDGVISITSQRLTEIRKECLRSYFFGTPEFPLKPHTINLKVIPMGDDGKPLINTNTLVSSTWCHLVELQIATLPASALPADQDVSMIGNQAHVLPYTKPLKSLVNTIAGICHAKNATYAPISSMAGVIHIRAVNEENSNVSTEDIQQGRPNLSSTNITFPTIEVWCPGLNEQGEFPSHYIFVGNTQKLRFHLE